MNKDRLFKLSLAIVAIIFIFNSLAMKYSWYYTIWWFDMPMHYFGGVFIGLASMAVYLSYFEQEMPSAESLAWIAFLSTLIIGVGWELFEVVMNIVAHTAQNAILDTWSDICYDLAGGFSAALYFLLKKL